MSFQFKKLAIAEVVLITPEIYADQRGFFLETYKYSEFAKNGIKQQFIQSNYSRSKKNALRGMHYQLPPYAQAKLVQVISGEIFDVAVDIRKGSPHYGQWVGEVLSGESKKILYIPEGFAHGFCTISEVADVVYYCTAEYAAGHDRGMIYNDSDVAIDWPITHPILSEKDRKLPDFKNAENDFEY